MMTDRQPILHNAEGGRSYGTLHNGINVHNDQITSQENTEDKVVVIKVYKRRWYILLVYGLMAGVSCCVWNTFGPIAEVSERVFGWNDGDISLLANWGPISYVFGAFAFSWIIDKKGLRPACVLAALLMTAGTGVRCITSDSKVATPLIHIGQFLNGLGGPVAMGAPPAISAEWFAPEQRTTATAISAGSNALGCAISFLLVPYLVPVQKINNQHPTETKTKSLAPTNRTGDLNLLDDITNGANNDTQKYDVASERKSIMKLMYIEFGMSVFCLLLYFTYFPSKPPLPPSPTASIQRVEFKTGLRQLFRNWTFGVICLTYGLGLGVLYCFGAVLDVNLKDHNISQIDAGYLGFYGAVGAIVSSLTIARFADIFSRRMKCFLVSLFTLGGGCFVVLTLCLAGIIPDFKAIIFASYIVGSVFMNAATPLFYETGCEVAYPVAEGVANLVLTLVNNLFGLVFLLIQMIPNIGTMWENWALLGAIFICVPLLLFLKEDYKRLNVDESSKEIPIEVNINDRHID